MVKKKNKEYIIIYRSLEHFEVLDWVEAESMEEAKKKAKKELIREANHYSVAEADIAEWGKDQDKVLFDI
jgi:hypothetical protein